MTNLIQVKDSQPSTNNYYFFFCCCYFSFSSIFLWLAHFSFVFVGINFVYVSFYMFLPSPKMPLRQIVAFVTNSFHLFSYNKQKTKNIATTKPLILAPKKQKSSVSLLFHTLLLIFSVLNYGFIAPMHEI